MHFNPRKYFLLFIMMSFQSFSQTIPEDQNITFSLKPVTCIVKKAGDICSMTINIHWQTLSPVNMCLYQGTTELQCWQQKNDVQTSIAITLDDNIELTLRNKKGQVLGKQHITINTVLPQKYRRRLRADWSLF